MGTHRWIVISRPLAVATALLLGASACSSDASGGITATLADFSITLSTSTTAAGEVTFDVSNTADQTHEFVVSKTDLAEGALPTGAEGDIEEEGAEDLSVIDEIEDIAAGTKPQLKVTLEPGKYVIFCNLPGHYRQGMHASFTVTG